jgi:acetyl-CoA carboxylase biotin carboxyl carrier protein
MEIKQIKELIAAMERAKLKKLSIKEKDGSELHLEREEEEATHSNPPQLAFSPPYHLPSFDSQARFSPPSLHEPLSVEVKEEVKHIGKYITSPMVGTFYTASAPGDPALVKVGDKVEENRVVCIIEAMKVMNEVKAGMSGAILEVCVVDGNPVEFGTRLFKIG